MPKHIYMQGQVLRPIFTEPKMACDATRRPLPGNYAPCKLQKGLGHQAQNFPLLFRDML